MARLTSGTSGASSTPNAPSGATTVSTSSGQAQTNSLLRAVGNVLAGIREIMQTTGVKQGPAGTQPWGVSDPSVVDAVTSLQTSVILGRERATGAVAATVTAHAVGDTAVQVAEVNVDRVGLAVVNEGEEPAWVAFTQATAGSGLRLGPGDTAEMAYVGPVWAVSTVEGTDVKVVQMTVPTPMGSV